MNWRLERVVLLLPVLIILIVMFVFLALPNIGSGEAAQPTIGLTAAATLKSPDGDSIGTVTFLQAAAGVLIKADLEGLAPGGHAFIIHETGSCTPDFAAAGDHFNPEDAEHGFIHPAWQRGESGEGHGGDLPNIYAASDGSARADFFKVGIGLDADADNSIFDDDGSAILVHEKPDLYGEQETETGRRLACGVIERT